MQIVIFAAQVLVGPVGERIGQGAVLIDGETIVAVGQCDEVTAAAASSAVTLVWPDATILPGLINAHVHLAFNGRPDRLEALMEETDEARLALAMAGRARQLLDCGITTARDLGDRNGLAVRVRDAIAEGQVAGPRILAATAPLTPPGGHCWFLGGQVDGPDQIRQQIHRNAAAGADVIKVMVSGGSITPGGAEMWESQFSTEDLRVAVQEAHQLGLPVAAHAHGTSSIRSAVDASVDTIEHCTWLTGPGIFEPCEHTVADIVAAGIAVCPANSGNWRPIAKRFGVERAQQLLGRVRWLADRGVRLITGTDAGLSPFDNFPEVLQGFQRWDFTPDQIIDMATVQTAAALGLSATAGRLAPGLSADLLVVPGDPLADLGALRHPELVIARGRPHKPQSPTEFRMDGSR